MSRVRIKWILASRVCRLNQKVPISRWVRSRMRSLIKKSWVTLNFVSAHLVSIPITITITVKFINKFKKSSLLFHPRRINHPLSLLHHQKTKRRKWINHLQKTKRRKRINHLQKKMMLSKSTWLSMRNSHNFKKGCHSKLMQLSPP